MYPLEQAAFVEPLGARNIVPHIDAALARAREIHAVQALPGARAAPALEPAVSR